MLKKPGGQLVYNRGSEEDEAGEAVGPYRYHGDMASILREIGGTSLVVQWIGLHVPMQQPRLDP